MPNAILRVGPFGTGTRFQSVAGNNAPINCNKRSWSNDSWKYVVNPFSTSRQHKSVSSNNATISESFSASVFFEFEAISFAYQAAQSFTLSGTYSINCADAQQDAVAFIIKTIVLGSDDGPIVFSDSANENISGSYTATFPAAVKPMEVFLSVLSESPGNATVTISGINP